MNKSLNKGQLSRLTIDRQLDIIEEADERITTDNDFHKTGQFTIKKQSKGLKNKSEYEMTITKSKTTLRKKNFVILPKGWKLTKNKDVKNILIGRIRRDLSRDEKCNNSLLATADTVYETDLVKNRDSNMTDYKQNNRTCTEDDINQSIIAQRIQRFASTQGFKMSASRSENRNKINFNNALNKTDEDFCNGTPENVAKVKDRCQVLSVKHVPSLNKINWEDNVEENTLKGNKTLMRSTNGFMKLKFTQDDANLGALRANSSYCKMTSISRRRKALQPELQDCNEFQYETNTRSSKWMAVYRESHSIEVEDRRPLRNQPECDYFSSKRIPLDQNKMYSTSTNFFAKNKSNAAKLKQEEPQYSIHRNTKISRRSITGIVSVEIGLQLGNPELC